MEDAITEYDLEIIKEQSNKLESTDLLEEGVKDVLLEDFRLFSMFMSGLVGFMTGKRALKSKRLNMVIRGNKREVAALRKALVSNKLLLKKIESGRATPRELDALRRQANLSKAEFEKLTGIRLPF